MRVTPVTARGNRSTLAPSLARTGACDIATRKSCTSPAHLILTGRCGVGALTAAQPQVTLLHMARTVVTQITDDLDGSKGADEVRFAFNGVDYAIDLSKKNRAALEKVLKPYIDAGTKVPARGRATRRSSAAASKGRRDLSEVRAWAKEQGIGLSDRGRVPAAVLEQYDNR